MEELSGRKLPPDREIDDLQVAQASKKSKNVENDDSIMLESERVSSNVKESQEVVPETQGMILDDNKGGTLSYKDSLLRFKGEDFNGIANGAGTMDEDPLISDIMEQSWSLPEPTEEVKELMKLYPSLTVTEEEFNESCQEWNSALIITVLGARFNYYKLKELLVKIWRFNEFDLVDLPNNYYAVRITNRETWGIYYKRILFEGPWVAGQHSILVQRWSPHFDPFTNQLGRIATWVRIPNVPLQWYSMRFMMRLGNLIGRTLKVDLHTLKSDKLDEARVERGRFVRICVEIDLQKKLIPKVIVANSIFNVEYEGLKMICFGCGKYGHRKETCPMQRTGTSPSNTPGVGEEEKKGNRSGAPETEKPDEVVTFGPWMVAQGSSKARVLRGEGKKLWQKASDLRSKKDMQGDTRYNQSRFAVLESWDEEREVSEKHRGGQNGTLVGDSAKGGQLVIWQERIKTSGSRGRPKQADRAGPSHGTVDTSGSGKGPMKPPHTGNHKAHEGSSIIVLDGGPKAIMGNSEGKRELGSRAHTLVLGSLEQPAKRERVETREASGKAYEMLREEVEKNREEHHIAIGQQPTSRRKNAGRGSKGALNSNQKEYSQQGEQRDTSLEALPPDK